MNRFVCEVLEEMRTCVKTMNFSYLAGLIEEVQVIANRMEAALGDNRDYLLYMERLHKAKQAAKEAEAISKGLDALKHERKQLEDAIKRARHQYDKVTKGDTVRCEHCGGPYITCTCTKGFP
jgi:hypothetical protein